MTCARFPGKARYPQKGTAKRAAKALRLKYRKESSAYFCLSCSGWHLTTMGA